jgi:tetratricopeptide (TPR) repeat protein
VLLLEATIAQRQDKWEQALALADQALAASPNDSQRFQISLIQGTVACRQNDLARARAALAETDKHSTTNGVLLAARERLNGNILWLEGNPAKAAVAMDRAASLFQQAGQYHEMALTLARASKAYQEAGDTRQAEDRRLRAERSLAAQKKTQ